MITQRNYIALAAAMLLTIGTAAAADTKSAPAAKNQAATITIYHLEGRRSERIVWLCEELGVPYKLEFKRGDLAGSMQTIRNINPLMAVAPTVRYGDQIMVESGAILELILARQGKGKLMPAVDSPDYPYYLQWMHFAEGSFAARVIADYRVLAIQGKQQPAAGRPRLVDAEGVLKFAEDFLSRNPYFGGKEFSAADIMMLFPLNFAGGLNIVDLEPFPNLVAWRTKVESRPAFKRMLAVARPDGFIGTPPALPKAAK
ncbi:MAG: glutathione S-transferase [Candidatus Obscuribacterales bacterium]|nr:glutathione S-transferase [Steroidobacteraceae bacterium]